MTTDTFEFKSGLVVTLCRVSPIFIGKIAAKAKDDWLKENEAPKCPTYEIKVAGGATELNELTEDTIGLDPWVNDPELQAKWEAYQTARRDLLGERITAGGKAYAIKGVVEEPPDEWVEEQAYWGLDLPDDPRDVKWEWLWQSSSGWDEITELSVAVQLLPNIVEEVARAAEDSFRNSLGAPDEGADARGDPETAKEEEA